MTAPHLDVKDHALFHQQQVLVQGVEEVQHLEVLAQEAEEGLLHASKEELVAVGLLHASEEVVEVEHSLVSELEVEGEVHQT